MLIGFALRLPLLNRYPFREDEAIYAYWALYSRWVDPLFLHVWPDKPPLFLWLLSLVFELWGATPAAARLLNIGCSVLTIPVLAATAHRWWGKRAALGAAAVAAASAFAVSFGPTGFTDPFLVLAGSLALAAAVRRRYFWSGVWLGAAIMTKQQGALFAPLVLAAGGLAVWERGAGDRHAGHLDGETVHTQAGFVMRRAGAALLWVVIGLAVVVLPILYWDSLRWAVAPSPWDLGARNVGAITLAAPAQWLERLRAWLALSWYLLASWPAWIGLGAVLVGACVFAGQRRAPARSWLPAAVVALWGAGFLGLHVATSVQIWDRYLLPLVILVALLAGWACEEWGLRFARVRPARLAWAAAIAAFALLLLGPAVQAANGEFPIGGDHGAYRGLDEAFAYVEQAGGTLYHRELGWHAEFYLFDALRTGALDLRYYPSAVYLADSATKLPHKRRFVIVPDWSPVQDLAQRIAQRGLRLDQRLRAGQMTLYEITTPPSVGNGWQTCRGAWPPPTLTAIAAPTMICPRFAAPGGPAQP